jgi:hypothetical protein
MIAEFSTRHCQDGCSDFVTRSRRSGYRLIIAQITIDLLCSEDIIPPLIREQYVRLSEGEAGTGSSLFVRTASVLRLKPEFAPPDTPPGVASVARTYFKFSGTPTWPHAVSISPLGIVAIGAITLIILTWAVCAYFASRRTVA